MENKTFNVSEETVSFKLICNVLESDALTVAKILNNANADVTSKIIDSILLGETEEDLNTAIHLFNAEQLSQSK